MLNCCFFPLTVVLFHIRVVYEVDRGGLCLMINDQYSTNKQYLHHFLTDLLWVEPGVL